MKFITEFDEEKKYQVFGKAIDDIKDIMSLSEILEIKKQLPKGEFKDDEEKKTAAGNQGFKNIMGVLNKLLVDHSAEMVKINHLFWEPEIVKKPVMVTEYNEEGFPVEVYKKDELGHVVFEDYEETEKDYPSAFKTIAKLPILAAKEPELIDFFTSLGGLKSLL